MGNNYLAYVVVDIGILRFGDLVSGPGEWKENIYPACSFVLYEIIFRSDDNYDRPFLTKSSKLKLEKTQYFQNSRQIMPQNSRFWIFYLVKISKFSS